MSTAQVLLKISLARESVAGAAVAIDMGTHEGLFGVVVLFVDLTLVAQEAISICKALSLVATRFVALVGPLMFIHMFAENG